MVVSVMSICGLVPAFIGNIGTGELLVILVLALLVLGPKQLPDAARSLARGLRGVRKAADDLRRESGVDEILSGGAEGPLSGESPARRVVELPPEAPPRGEPSAGVELPPPTDKGSGG